MSDEKASETTPLEKARQMGDTVGTFLNFASRHTPNTSAEMIEWLERAFESFEPQPPLPLPIPDEQLATLKSALAWDFMFRHECPFMVGWIRELIEQLRRLTGRLPIRERRNR